MSLGARRRGLALQELGSIMVSRTLDEWSKCLEGLSDDEEEEKARAARVAH